MKQILISNIDSLTGRQVYDVCRLRQDVFTIEQNIRVPELDDTDLVATHILLYEDDILASYARVYKDDNEVHIKIGRVVTAKTFRGKSLGSDVIRQSIQVAQD
jgi:ElaA protein